MKNKKSLGQHWLTDRSILMTIAALAAEDGVDSVLEIGPGLGTLTSALLKYFKEVVAVELDENLAKNLPNSFPGKNLRVIQGDILSLDLKIMPKEYVAAGNVPYYITSPILRKFLTTKHKPKKIVLLVQKEVAQRVAARDGEHSVLSLSVQGYGAVELGPVVEREWFTPAPKVDSQVVIVRPYKNPLLHEKNLAFIKYGFRMPRKKLVSNLSGYQGISKDELRLVLNELGLDANVRPSDLSIENWQNLEKKLHKH